MPNRNTLENFSLGKRKKKAPTEGAPPPPSLNFLKKKGWKARGGKFKQGNKKYPLGKIRKTGMGKKAKNLVLGENKICRKLLP